MDEEKSRVDYEERPPSKEEEANTKIYKPRKSRKKPELDGRKIKLTVGQVITIRRRQLGLSQEELAWRSGISRTQMGRIERDESEPSVSTIENMEAALVMELYDLFMSQKRMRSQHRGKKQARHLSEEPMEEFELEVRVDEEQKADSEDASDASGSF